MIFVFLLVISVFKMASSVELKHRLVFLSARRLGWPFWRKQVCEILFIQARVTV